MEIIANSYILKIISNIDIFQLDLGNNLTGKRPEPGKGEEMKITITDLFIKKYSTNVGRFIYKYGNIGNLKFYMDMLLSNKEMQIHLSEELIYDIEINEELLRSNPRTYLSNILQNIENIKNSQNIQIETKDEDFHLLHISSAPEHVEKPEIDLPKDQYITEMAARRQKLSPIDPNDTELQKIIEKRRKKNIEKYGY